MRVLITGAAGNIGAVLVAGLGQRHQLRGLDLSPMPALEDAIVGDLTDLDTVMAAAEGVDAVIHLGAKPSGGEWPDILHSNIVGTYNVFEACRRRGVPRVAYASRAGLLSRYPRNLRREISHLPQPDSLYSVSKVFGESVGYLYATRHGMAVVCVRIGNFKADRPRPEHPHHLGREDCVRLFERAIVHPGVRFEIVFGVSASNWPLYDLDHGRRAIGYEPQERSEVPPEQWEE